MRYILILAFLIAFNKLTAQTLNVESAKKFWEVIDIVKKDNKISDSLWNEYRNAKANSL